MRRREHDGIDRFTIGQRKGLGVAAGRKRFVLEILPESRTVVVGDPEDLLRGIQEFAAKQAETVQEAQREQFATLTLNTAVELTGAALSQLNPQGTAEEQAMALRDAMRVLFPEAVALVSAARQGFMRES